MPATGNATLRGPHRSARDDASTRDGIPAGRALPAVLIDLGGEAARERRTALHSARPRRSAPPLADRAHRVDVVARERARALSGDDHREQLALAPAAARAAPGDRVPHAGRVISG